LIAADNPPTPDGAVLLEVQDLSTCFETGRGPCPAVDNVSFRVHEGECLGIVGESGCGKTVTCLSILGLIDYPGRITSGQILFHGQDLRKLPERTLREVRGAKISMVFQDPQTALNPVLSIGAQMFDVIRTHEHCGQRHAQEIAEEKLRAVGITDARARLAAFPFELSGGLRQRVTIAMALSCNPELLIADEPTTSLDVSIQAQILDLIQELRHTFDLAIIYVSHDLGVIANIAESILVMYAGRTVEHGPISAIMKSPAHPYTRALIESIPTLRSDHRKARLHVIRGSRPDLGDLPPGCAFSPRCERALPICTTDRPEFLVIGPDRSCACHNIYR